jgi:hypothetical protein
MSLKIIEIKIEIKPTELGQMRLLLNFLWNRENTETN